MRQYKHSVSPVSGFSSRLQSYYSIYPIFFPLPLPWKKNSRESGVLQNAAFKVKSQLAARPSECSKSVWAANLHTDVFEQKERQAEFRAAAVMENICCPKYFGNVSMSWLLMVSLNTLSHSILCLRAGMLIPKDISVVWNITSDTENLCREKLTCQQT